ncbi:proline-rich protein 36-like isoform X1 [Iris pallida]|uniref:Proline-rich protein 36-like isoform X1 n=1 Tax=Iris pallida TaxID=29817 RepID=A0AAX6IA40_IRIPA|nr:proline-rich protein 36-like isoform X1 [Iris pallida]KAJ6849634.1 proline-rich protein 36-like isoform X1 [Iris pallida]
MARRWPKAGVWLKKNALGGSWRGFGRSVGSRVRPGTVELQKGKEVARRSEVEWLGRWWWIDWSHGSRGHRRAKLVEKKVVQPQPKGWLAEN